MAERMKVINIAGDGALVLPFVLCRAILRRHRSRADDERVNASIVDILLLLSLLSAWLAAAAVRLQRAM